VTLITSVDGYACLQGDCIEIPLEDRVADLCFTSPPYEDARLYGDLGFRLKGMAWVEWAVPRFIECLRVTKGMVCWVVQGRTRGFEWSATPALFMAKLVEAGVTLRRPHIYHRSGIPGSGGPDDWRNDYEFVIRATHGGRLPWANNVASGKPCKFPVGGQMSYRTQDGQRRNQKTGKRLGEYRGVAVANPGDVLHLKVGGGLMGSSLAHETEAPFPESLVEPYVRCFCPPGGLVIDPMCGSGTTLAVAVRWKRNAFGMDVRESQVELSKRRILESSSAGYM